MSPVPDHLSRREVIGPCPTPGCGGQIVEYSRAYGCTSYKSRKSPGCGYTIWKVAGGQKVEPDAAREMVARGESNAAPTASNRETTEGARTPAGEFAEEVRTGLKPRGQNGTPTSRMVRDSEKDGRSTAMFVVKYDGGEAGRPIAFTVTVAEMPDELNPATKSPRLPLPSDAESRDLGHPRGSGGS